MYHQQPDARARDELHDHAWAALQLLIDEGCVELVRQPRSPTDKRVVPSTNPATPATAEAKTAGGGGSARGAVAVGHGHGSLLEPPLPASKRQKVAPGQQEGAHTPRVRAGVGTAIPVARGGQDKGFEELRSAGGDGDNRGGGGPAAGHGGVGEDDRLLMPTKLGMAIFRSSMPPGDGLMVYRDLSGEGGGCPIVVITC